jgi:hypothetical protein
MSSRWLLQSSHHNLEVTMHGFSLTHRISVALALIWLLTAASQARAQAAAITPAPCEDAERDETEGAGTFWFGPGLFALSSLSDRLAEHGYDRLPSSMPVIGGEGHAVFPSGFVVGGHGAALLAPGRDGPDDLELSFGGGFGLADFGFAPVHTQSLLFTMTGGIGGYGWNLGIGTKDRVAFDDVLDDPRRSASLSRGGVLVGATLGLDVRFALGRAERGRQGLFTIGLRVGGLYGPPIGKLSLAEGDEVSDAPDVGLTGGYAALALGFGGGPAGSAAATARR